MAPIIESMCGGGTETTKKEEYSNGTLKCAEKSGFTMEQLAKTDFLAAGFDDKVSLVFSQPRNKV